MSQTLDFLFNKYGVLLNTSQLAEVLGLARGTVSNRLSQGKLPFTAVFITSSPQFKTVDIADYLNGSKLGKSKAGRKPNTTKSGVTL